MSQNASIIYYIFLKTRPQKFLLKAIWKCANSIYMLLKFLDWSNCADVFIIIYPVHSRHAMLNVIVEKIAHIWNGTV